ncbi:4-(cytidine 5'-diphospho)-2-C-methyl-D-erythritol kinase [Leptolyngbya sp. NM3-A1]|nr:4-(cytidine 5'-diphospho)-2-C-methyl-D-erythritol kinase [Leptolyngbya sp. FACHB-16]
MDSVPMRSYLLTAPAKINFYLEILGDRPDGYHELAMVMQSIALADRIQIRPNGTTRIQVQCDNPEVPADTSNLAYRAAKLMADEFEDAYSQYGGVDIFIEKNIPIGAGLAGGSTDAAAVLVGLDLMWGLGLTQIELQELAARLGSDIPFCVSGGTAIATGRGERLAPLTDLSGLSVVLGKYRSLSVSTPWAYKTYRQQFGHTYIRESDRFSTQRQAMQSGALVSAISHQDTGQIGKYLHNDLEKVVLPEYPQVAELKAAMQACNPLGCMMSGSGPTVFALAATPVAAAQIRDRVRETIPNPDLQLWVTELCPTGIQLASS